MQDPPPAKLLQLPLLQCFETKSTISLRYTCILYDLAILPLAVVTRKILAKNVSEDMYKNSRALIAALILIAKKLEIAPVSLCLINYGIIIKWKTTYWCKGMHVATNVNMDESHENNV